MSGSGSTLIVKLMQLRGWYRCAAHGDWVFFEGGVRTVSCLFARSAKVARARQPSEVVSRVPVSRGKLRQRQTEEYLLPQMLPREWRCLRGMGVSD
jgi:hypothetical protein